MLDKHVDAIRFINSGLIIFEDLDNIIQKNQINHTEIGQSIIDNVFLMAFMKGETCKDVDVNVALKVRTSIMSVLIEAYLYLAEMLTKIDR